MPLNSTHLPGLLSVSWSGIDVSPEVVIITMHARPLCLPLRGNLVSWRIVLACISIFYCPTHSISTLARTTCQEQLFNGSITGSLLLLARSRFLNAWVMSSTGCTSFVLHLPDNWRISDSCPKISVRLRIIRTSVQSRLERSALLSPTGCRVVAVRPATAPASPAAVCACSSPSPSTTNLLG